LGEIGREARDAQGALATLTGDPNPAVAKFAADALVRIRE
jgi:hypothetical protein